MDWRDSHHECLGLARCQSKMDFDIGNALRRALGLEVHVELGDASFFEYAERIFGYGRRTTEERLRVADALDDLPNIRTALIDGAIRWCAARELTRIATPLNEVKWLDHCAGMTVHQIERVVARHEPGADPGDCGPLPD